MREDLLRFIHGEALALAFRALVDLQRAGRLVSIISHGLELKGVSTSALRSFRHHMAV
jgi:hypothetical protein